MSAHSSGLLFGDGFVILAPTAALTKDLALSLLMADEWALPCLWEEDFKLPRGKRTKRHVRAAVVDRLLHLAFARLELLKAAGETCYRCGTPALTGGCNACVGDEVMARTLAMAKRSRAGRLG